ncbi:hypothetical protein ZYGR_0H01190 [Zygosaccharomyces rouxii]|uniref:ZYRO0B06688p n=2 Tax=Zygosaccharomyces rouxii TaxID=4956 RepID=C5DR99_ZYGRC|nr:uncharacterized protein ZYRO0B06688g [Zygosaccharomyces rouxii]KAH9200145.1 hypothetical protein LQ764DRAFT_234675 [Zygosaccharomyces rouxii]GAV47278.1 hypothetical protein ZYGR_0H01190 [Zygosaccharomyces rouxii]CAR26310.1 ZYRO0B06688p [Zygosaccharomyces rouxii]
MKLQWSRSKTPPQNEEVSSLEGSGANSQLETSNDNIKENATQTLTYGADEQNAGPYSTFVDGEADGEDKKDFEDGYDEQSVFSDEYDEGLSWFVIVLTLVSSISGFMFGYDTGYISSALTSVKQDLSNKTLSYGDKEILTAATSLGAFISSLFAGIVADIIGRKPSIMASNVMFLVGIVLQVCAHKYWQMAAGRLIMGFGVGVGSLVAPLFIGEIAPSMIRGRLTVINSLCVTGGQLVAYACGAGLTHVNNGWRVLVGLALIPVALQFAFFMFLPDTPRYYVMKNDVESARKVLRRTYRRAPDRVIDAKVKELHELNDGIDGKNVLDKVWNMTKELHANPANLRALIIACGLQGIQQFTGFNSLMYFSGTIFETVGFNNSSAVSLIVSGTNFVFTVIAFFTIDKLGRRPILLIGVPGMMVALIICAISFHFIGIKFEGTSAIVEHSGFTSWGILIIVFIVVYAAFYALGIGTVPWQQSELFPQNVRGVGTSLSTATNWAGSLVIAACFLTMLQNITPSGTFALFAAIAAVSSVFIYFCYPELSGLELEEVQEVLKNGFGIKKSKELAKHRKKQAAAAKAAAQHKIPRNEIMGD